MIKKVARREGRTRSLQMPSPTTCEGLKSLTLYPIELGGQLKCFFF